MTLACYGALEIVGVIIIIIIGNYPTRVLWSMTSRDPTCGNIGTLVDQKSF